jgi:hypothetical protein
MGIYYIGFKTGDRPVFPRTDLQIRKIRRNMCGQVARPGRRGGGSSGGGGGSHGQVKHVQLCIGAIYLPVSYSICICTPANI